MLRLQGAKGSANLRAGACPVLKSNKATSSLEGATYCMTLLCRAFHPFRGTPINWLKHLPELLSYILLQMGEQQLDV